MLVVAAGGVIGDTPIAAAPLAATQARAAPPQRGRALGVAATAADIMSS